MLPSDGVGAMIHTWLTGLIERNAADIAAVVGGGLIIASALAAIGIGHSFVCALIDLSKGFLSALRRGARHVASAGRRRHI